MEKVTKLLLDRNLAVPGMIGLAKGAQEITEGASLRELKFLLKKLDPKEQWGGLRAAPTETGEVLWLCPKHYEDYVPRPATSR